MSSSVCAPVNIGCVSAFSDVLLQEHPPQFRGNKLKVFKKCMKNRDLKNARQKVVVSRWRPGELPFSVECRLNANIFESNNVEMKQSIYKYRCRIGHEKQDEGEGSSSTTATTETETETEINFHVNFANQRLFGYYNANVLAQDEQQVLEHPILGSVKEAFADSDEIVLLTTEKQTQIPTPICISGAPRFCTFHTGKSRAQLRPKGLYGIQFTQATADAVIRAAEVIVNTATSNIVAMEAPSNGRGKYTREMMMHILTTAYTAFSSTVAHSKEHLDIPNPNLVVHTGFWGCGVYGGSRILMIILQVIAAWMSGVKLVFYTVDSDGSKDFKSAEKRLFSVINELQTGDCDEVLSISVDVLIDMLVRLNFRWR